MICGCSHQERLAGTAAAHASSERCLTRRPATLSVLSARQHATSCSFPSSPACKQADNVQWKQGRIRISDTSAFQIFSSCASSTLLHLQTGFKRTLRTMDCAARQQHLKRDDDGATELYRRWCVTILRKTRHRPPPMHPFPVTHHSCWPSCRLMPANSAHTTVEVSNGEDRLVT